MVPPFNLKNKSDAKIQCICLRNVDAWLPQSRIIEVI